MIVWYHIKLYDIIQKLMISYPGYDIIVWYHILIYYIILWYSISYEISYTICLTLCPYFMHAFPLRCRHWGLSGGTRCRSRTWFWGRSVNGPGWCSWLCRSISLSWWFTYLLWVHTISHMISYHDITYEIWYHTMISYMISYMMWQYIWFCLPCFRCLHEQWPHSDVQAFRVEGPRYSACA